jgi:hypothetical protein
MKEVKSAAEKIAQIYRESGAEAERYLRRTRKLKDLCGPSFAVIYCWFYSVPQRWIQVEPKIFELAKKTNSFDLDIILKVSKEKLAAALEPMIFRNEISLQLKNFCKAIKNEYLSWGNFANALKEESIFAIFEKLRRYKNTRLTFKNLAAMKIFVGMNNSLIILDTHIAKMLGISKTERGKYVAWEKSFQSLLDLSRKVTNELKKKGLDVSGAKWSLAIWFNKTKIPANRLLQFI